MFGASMAGADGRCDNFFFSPTAKNARRCGGMAPKVRAQTMAEAVFSCGFARFRGAIFCPFFLKGGCSYGLQLSAPRLACVARLSWVGTSCVIPVPNVCGVHLIVTRNYNPNASALRQVGGAAPLHRWQAVSVDLAVEVEGKYVGHPRKVVKHGLYLAVERWGMQVVLLAHPVDE